MDAPAPTVNPRFSCPRPGRFLAHLVAPLLIALTLAAVCGLAVVSAEEEPAVLALAAAPTATPPAPDDDLHLRLVEADATGEPEDPVQPMDADEPAEPAGPAEPAVQEIVAVEEVVPGPADDDITVEIRIGICPTDVAAIADDIAALAAACPSAPAGLMPLLNQEGVTTAAFTDASGAASWADRALGTAYLALNLPAESGMPIAYCRDDLPGSDWVRYTVTGSLDQAAISAELTVPGAWFICDWYLPPAPRSITIQAWSCPVELLATNEDVADFLDACVAPVDGLGFRLDTGSGVLQGETAGGAAVWGDLPLAPILIEAGQPEGFGQPAVFCASDGSVAFAPYPAPASTMVYDFTAVPGPNALCHWFTIPDQGKAAVFKWVCPQGINAASEDVAYFYAKCKEVGDGIVFHLQKDGLDLPQTFIKGAGWVSWDGIDGGTATIWEEIPAGFVQPVVFCTGATSPYGPANPYELMAVDSGRIELAFGETYLHYSCHWYNIPGDPNSNDGWLDLTTYACPAGAIDDAAAADAAAFAAACPATQDGIPVTLDLGDGHAPFGATTGDDGPGRTFFPLPDGTYSEVSLSEDLPAAVTGSAVFCRYSGPASAPVPETEWAGGANWLDLEPGTTALCNWYNLLAPDGGDDGGDIPDGGTDTDTDDGPGGSDAGADGSDGGGGSDSNSGTGTAGDPEPPLVVTLPDTGAGPASAAGSTPPAWIWPLVALAGAMGLALRPARRP